MAGLVFLFMSYAPISRMIKSCISYGLGMVSEPNVITVHLLYAVAGGLNGSNGFGV